MWAMRSQALFTDVPRACRAAVPRVAVDCALVGREVSSTNTGAYRRARAKGPEGVVRRVAEGVAERCEAAVPDDWRWHGFRTLVIDGTTFSRPDTEENQAEYPQPSSQTAGLGFPILRAVALTSLATGMVLGLARGRLRARRPARPRCSARGSKNSVAGIWCCPTATTAAGSGSPGCETWASSS